MYKKIFIFLLAFFIISPRLFSICFAVTDDSGGTDLYNNNFLYEVPKDKKDKTDESLLFHVDLVKLREAEAEGRFTDLKIFFDDFHSDFFKRDLKGFPEYKTNDSVDVYIQYSFYKEKYAQIKYYLVFEDGTKLFCKSFYPADPADTTYFDVDVRLVGYGLTDSFNIGDIFDFNYSTPTEDLDNYNFTGVRFAYPNSDYTGEENRYQMTCNVKFRIPIDWSYLENKIQSVGNKFFYDSVLKNMEQKLYLDGQPCEVRKITWWGSYKKNDKYYAIDIDDYDFCEANKNGYFIGSINMLINLPTGKSADGRHTLKFTGEFPTSLKDKTLSLKGYEYKTTEYSCSIDFGLTGVIDDNADGVDDRTNKNVGEDPAVVANREEEKPNKDDYEDNMWGAIEYVFDTIFYWISRPFDLIKSCFDILVTSVQSISSWFSNFGSFIGSFFSFLPYEIRTVAITVVTCTGLSIILAMFLKR